jgi:putative membrane protein
MNHSRPDYSATQQSFSFPGYHSSKRKKPRRLPLLLRVARGSAVHHEILMPVLLHSLFNVIVTYIDTHVRPVGLQGPIVSSLAIVVGLMLVFRNGTSYDRFWSGRNSLTGVVTNAKNLSRCFIVSSRSLKDDHVTDEEKKDTENIVRLLIAFLYSVKHHLRREFAPDSSPAGKGAPYPMEFGSTNRKRSDAQEGLPEAPLVSVTTEEPMTSSTPLLTESYMSDLSDSQSTIVYSGILRSTTITSLENRGVALPMQLSFSIEAYIRRGHQREWWLAPQASMLQATLNALIGDWQHMDSELCQALSIMILILVKPFEVRRSQLGTLFMKNRFWLCT